MEDKFKQLRRRPPIERYSFETHALQQGYQRIAGIDEAGRGPLAGPVVAACVILNANIEIFEEIDDSKKLTPAKRAELFSLIHKNAFDIGVGIIDHQTIDRVNILQATFLAMKMAVEKLKRMPDFILIDGNQRPIWAQHAVTIIKGDQLSLSISAASIIAKETRDQIMREYDQIYPQWGFAQHMGYGTAAHMAAIRKYGISDIHRRTFSPISQLSLGFAK